MERYQTIADQVRLWIVNGIYQPGDRLPTREELCGQLSTTVPTVQKALSLLEREGFVVSRRRGGTRVVSHPPHLHQFGLVFDIEHQHEGYRSLWHEAVRAAAGELARSGNRRFHQYREIDGHADVEDFARLQADVAHHRLGALLFMYPAYWLHQSQLPETEIPLVCFADRGAPGVPVVSTDSIDFVGKAVRRLAAEGRKRVAFLSTGQWQGNNQGSFLALIQSTTLAAGLKTEPYWIVPVSPFMPEGARVVTQLLFSGPADHRPDALVIMDDHVVEQATLGLTMTDLDLVRDVQVIAHCNYPLRPRALSPVTWLGFDVRQLIEQMINVTSLPAHQRRAATMTTIPALFEDELQNTQFLDT